MPCTSRLLEEKSNGSRQPALSSSWSWMARSLTCGFGGISAPKPPWDRTVYDILIPVPLAYDLGTGLDDFYIALPYSFNNGEHNRVNGQALTLKDPSMAGSFLALPRRQAVPEPESTLSRVTLFIAEVFSWRVELSMPGFNLRIRESDWARLRKHCEPSFRGRKDTEIGAIGLLGTRMIGGANCAN